MIEAMRELALLTLQIEFGQEGAMAEIRRRNRKKLVSWLVEQGENIERAYILEKMADKPDTVRMTCFELDARKRSRLPFVKPSGNNASAVGPVIKRSYEKGKSPPFGPKRKVVATTLKSFEALSQGVEPWAAYFKEIGEILEADYLLWEGRSIRVDKGNDQTKVIGAAQRAIPDTKTVFIAVADREGKWPGDRADYWEYIERKSGAIKYATKDAPPRAHATCPLCDSENLTTYPNALKGAGINIANMDRAGAFPGVRIKDAWKGYALCLDCADLLYIFKYHVSKDFVGRIAGRRALLIPALLGNQQRRRQVLRDFKKYVRDLKNTGIASRERDLIEFFAGRYDAHVVLNILWAQFGQVIEDVEGAITDVLPSRLNHLAKLNRVVNGTQHPCFPEYVPQEAQLDLSLTILGPLFHRPGPRKTGGHKSAGIGHLQRMVAASLYHGTAMKGLEALFWDEVMETARSYLDAAIRNGNAWGLCDEGIPRKGGRRRYVWTLAGWMRHLARFVYYLRQTEVLLMNEQRGTVSYTPDMEALREYFTPETGIDSREKAFAFLLGVLFGKLIRVQAARKVNVASNALTWLKRLQLTGADLPELYVKIREKLLSYGTEQSQPVRRLTEEIGRLATRLPQPIMLDRISTCYFLLLGQSLSNKILPKTEIEADKSQEEVAPQ